MKAKNLVIFDLPAVVRYDHLPLRKALVNAIATNLTGTPILEDINWSSNAQSVVHQIFQTSLGRNATPIEIGCVIADFEALLKKYFLLHDDPFDVWSGIQNIFQDLDRREDWGYVIISDYWRDSTEFILSSCGIFSQGKTLLTAEDGSNSQELALSIGAKHESAGGKLVFLMTKGFGHIESAAVNNWQYIKPPLKNQDDLLEYPRFSKLFRLAKI